MSIKTMLMLCFSVVITSGLHSAYNREIPTQTRATMPRGWRGNTSSMVSSPTDLAPRDYVGFAAAADAVSDADAGVHTRNVSTLVARVIAHVQSASHEAVAAHTRRMLATPAAVPLARDVCKQRNEGYVSAAWDVAILQDARFEKIG